MAGTCFGLDLTETEQHLVELRHPDCIHLYIWPFDVPELPTQEARKTPMVVAAHMEVVESSSTEVEPYELMEQGLFAASQMEDDREYGVVCRTAAENVWLFCSFCPAHWTAGAWA